jgi:hypothetical protein
LWLTTKGLDGLIELVGWAQGQIEKKDPFSVELATSTAAAAKPLLADLVPQTPGQIDRLFQQFYRVHPSFSKQPASVTGNANGGDYSGLGYSCPGDFDDIQSSV